MFYVMIYFFFNILRKSILTADFFDLSPGATIILTEETEAGSVQSSSSQLYITLNLLLLCLFFIKICNL